MKLNYPITRLYVFSSLARLPRYLMISACALLVSPPNLLADPAPVNLDTAKSFGVLAGSGITVTGPTTILGDIGSYPTPSITGFENVTLSGVNHAGDAVTQAAKSNVFAAYADASVRTPSTSFGAIYDLGGLSLLSGVYNVTESFGITGALTLDGKGDVNAIWIFQSGTTLTTASNSQVNLIGGAQASNVFWQVGSSATLNTGSDFSGNILAAQSITLNTGASITGGLYALNGAVTLDSNFINNVPEPGSVFLLLTGLGSLFIRRKR